MAATETTVEERARRIRMLLLDVDGVLTDGTFVPLGDATRILPGHGPATTVGAERRSNPFLQEELRGEILRGL